MKKVFSKCLFLLFSLALVQVYKASGQQNYLAYLSSDKSVVLTDNFDNNTNQWITDNLWINGKFTGGYYIISCKNYQQSTGLSCKTVQIPSGKDYEIEAMLKSNKGIGGLVFGMTDNYDHYRIEISDKNAVEVIKDTPSKKKKIEKLFSGQLNAAGSLITFHKITIRSVNGIFYVFSDEVLMGQFNNIKPEGSQVGFNVGLNSELSVDYLKITTLKNQTETTPSKADEIMKGTIVFSPEKNENPPAGSSPVITWVSPLALNTNLEIFTANIRAAVKSPSGIISVMLYLNGVSKGEAVVKPVPGESDSFIVEKTVNFGPGENNIYLIATSNQGTTKSDLRYFTNPSAVPPVITWSNPADPNVIVANENVPISACINSFTELKSIKVLVNGNEQFTDNVFRRSASEECNYDWQSSVVLKDGDNTIYIIATNEAGSIRSEKRVIKLSATMAERRLALVFGNSVYNNNNPLKNPANDANLMEGTLKELGFDVIKRLNAGKDQMMGAIREFNERLPKYNVALFYYAGHGVQVEGKNYLIPVDAKLEKNSDCRFEAIPVDFVVEEFERYPDNTNIVILDACRNNPFVSWARGGEPGFRAMNQSSGTIISFATSEGATAADGKGDNGLFTEELVKQMAVPQSIFNVFAKTRQQVRKLSNNTQTPQEWNKLNGDFYFKK